MVISVKKTKRKEGETSSIAESHSSLSPNAANIIRYGIGFDVHKQSITVCVKVQLRTSEIVEVQTHKFNTTPKGLQELTRFLQHFHPVAHYLLECTGVYHLPLYYALQKTFPSNRNQIVAMNPLLVHRRLTDFGKKTDKADAASLATLAFYDALIKPSYIGSVQYMQLREMIRSHYRSQTHCTRLKNRIHRNLDAANLQFPFDFNKEWCLNLLDYYINQSGTLLEAYTAYIKIKQENGEAVGVLLKQGSEIARFGEISLSPEQRFLLQMDLSRLLHEELVAASYLKSAEEHILASSDFQIAYQHLLQIPGIGSVSALTILTEVGDYYRFISWKAFALYCGVVPSVEQSAETKHKGHINTCTNRLLRLCLTQVAGVLLNRSNRDSDLAIFAFKQIAQRGIPYKKALIKVAQKLARTIYSVLVTGVVYDSMHEKQERERVQQQRRLQRNQTLLESTRLRALKRDIQGFLVSNSELLNSTSKYHLKLGFLRLIRRGEWKERHDEEKK